MRFAKEARDPRVLPAEKLEPLSLDAEDPAVVECRAGRNMIAATIEDDEVACAGETMDAAAPSGTPVQHETPRLDQEVAARGIAKRE